MVYFYKQLSLSLRFEGINTFVSTVLSLFFWLYTGLTTELDGAGGSQSYPGEEEDEIQPPTSGLAPQAEVSLPRTLTNKHPVMYLNELKRNLTYQLVSEQEVDKEKLYTMSVVIDGREFNGTAKSKKLAKMEAARVALESLYNAVYVPGRVVYSTL